MTDNPELVITCLWIGTRVCGIIVFILLLVFAISNNQIDRTDEACRIVLKNEK